MSHNWTHAQEARYNTAGSQLLKTHAHWITLVAIILFPLFSVLDYFGHAQHFRELTLIRYSTVLIYLVIFFFIRKGKLLTYPFLFSVSVFAIAAASITAMCAVVGGHESPYYAGIGLVLAAAVTALPVGPKQMAIVLSAILLIYAVGPLLTPGYIVQQPHMVVNNAFFLLSTAFIGMVASFLIEKARRTSFSQYLELEKAQADLKRSKDILQLELQSEQSNVEELVRQITEKKTELEKALVFAEASKEEAQQALSLREEFISMASHELNTPLTALQLQTDLASLRLSHHEEIESKAWEKLINSYGSQLKRLIHIVNDMLDISRIRSGKLELSRKEVNLETLVRDVLERISHKVSEAGVHIRVETTQSLIGLWDQFRIEQVILNLITNALKYGKNMPVDIVLDANAKEAHFKIIDRGIGISHESQQRIFERFERAVNPSDFAGLGLGLYISRQIIEAHGGRITVESEPGVGSTFTVYLPFNIS